jgi:hypothetical protein
MPVPFRSVANTCMGTRVAMSSATSVNVIAIE